MTTRTSLLWGKKCYLLLDINYKEEVSDVNKIPFRVFKVKYESSTALVYRSAQHTEKADLKTQEASTRIFGHTQLRQPFKVGRCHCKQEHHSRVMIDQPDSGFERQTRVHEQNKPDYSTPSS